MQQVRVNAALFGQRVRWHLMGCLESHRPSERWCAPSTRPVAAPVRSSRAQIMPRPLEATAYRGGRSPAFRTRAARRPAWLPQGGVAARTDARCTHAHGLEYEVHPKVNPTSDGKFGRVAALDLRTHRVVWTDRRRAPPASAMLATAGGIVFEGSKDRAFRALDNRTGSILWETPLNDTPNGFPISFAVDGSQYVATISGGGTPFDITPRYLTPEIQNSSGARTIWVFKLRDEGSKAGDAEHER